MQCKWISEGRPASLAAFLKFLEKYNGLTGKPLEFVNTKLYRLFHSGHDSFSLFWNSRHFLNCSQIFAGIGIERKEGYEAKYDELLRENELLFTVDLVKEKLSEAYHAEDEIVMAGCIIDIMDMCEATGNRRLGWFRNMLDKHFEGIIAHATYRKLSAGKIEGINNKIKTTRRQGYGYPDDEYFFLKLFDMSRRDYVRNELSHKICD